jgi:uncharacterized protein involved in propanediol utilization
MMHCLMFPKSSKVDCWPRHSNLRKDLVDSLPKMGVAVAVEKVNTMGRVAEVGVVLNFLNKPMMIETAGYWKATNNCLCLIVAMSGTIHGRSRKQKLTLGYPGFEEAVVV